MKTPEIIIFFSFLLIIVFLAYKRISFKEQEFEIQGKKLTVELADTQTKRMKGLMGRNQLDENKGMLFVFPHEAKHGFWMANTKIALDIIWMDKDYKIVHVETDVPPCTSKVLVNCPTYAPKFPAKYVLEVNAGWWDK